MRINIFFIFFILSCILFSQENFQEIKLNEPKKITFNNQEFIVPNILNGVYIEEESRYLYYFKKIPIDYSEFDVLINNIEYNTLDPIYSSINLPANLDYEYFLITEKKQKFLGLKIFPYVQKSNEKFILKSFNIDVSPKKNQPIENKRAVINNSVLSNGQWFKIAVEEDGVYAINKEFLNSLGIDSDFIDPKKIRIFGGHVGMLPEENIIPRVDDLEEIAVYFSGDDDGLFEEDEELLFYGKSPHIWELQEDSNNFFHKQNIYSNQTYYFITINQGTHKSVENIGYSLEDIFTFSEPQIRDIYDFKERVFHERELYNLVSTGQQWFGDYFGGINQLLLNLESGNIILKDSIFFRARVAARSSIPSNFEFYLPSVINNFCVIDVPAENSDDYYYEAVEKSLTLDIESGKFFSNNWDGSLIINYNNNGNPSALAWLDFVELSFTKDLQYFSQSNQLNFNAFPSTAHQLDLFHLPLETYLAFDVSNPFEMKKLDLYNSNLINIDSNNEHYIFAQNIENFSEYVCIKEDSYKTPIFIEIIPNQNLHSYTQADLIIVTHSDFLNQANRLAEFHQNYDGINVIVVTDKQIYNEFSAGSQDPVAIRDFVRMLYNNAINQSDLPKNLLLFGDASFDYKNILSNNTNFIPTFQSYRSDNIKLSYCSDDFFGMLDDNEGSGSTLIYDLMDIGVGRIPVQTNNEAEEVIDKIINYSSVSSRGDWKNNICFVADDVDDTWEINLMIHADALATKVDTSYNWVNIDKIYTDGYQQISTAGGERYPEAQDDLIELVNQGALIINYIGHGGEVGWASERILELSDINNFENFDNLAVFITATCEFSRFDDPARISAGEQLLLNPNGGAVSLYSTSRTVNESSAYYIADALYNYILDTEQNLTMGEIMRKAKNDPSLGVTVNKRKFAFLGDPALKISYPKYRVQTDQIFLIGNDKENNISSDTINALSRVKVLGKISDENEKKAPLNGILYITVFGKKDVQNTLNNNGLLESPFSFEIQNDVIYKGKVDVINGDFEYEFIVPKDVPIDYGQGKLSYYVNDLDLGDGTGYFEDFFVGGLNSNPNLDKLGPEIQLFINDTTFVSGGFTDDSPDLLGVLYDDSGINTVGTGIGHDLVAILDGVTNNPYILNDSYEADLNTFQSGRVSFSFSDLEEGVHTLSLKAWDVHNNSNSKQISFIVAKSEDIILEHVLNYPNPFSNFTRFSFEHNRPNEVIDVLIQVFSVSGKLVKTLSNEIINNGYRDDSIVWDGFDDFGDKLAKGVYLYRVVLKSKNDGSKVEKFEKLVILQ